MAANLLEALNVTITSVSLKFEITPDTTTLVNGSFTLTTNEATPVAIANPFETIVLADDYNSLARTLVLTWNSGVLSASTDYILTISGIKNISGDILSDVQIQFTTGASVTPDPSLTAEEQVVYIVDQSIQYDLFSGSSNVSVIFGGQNSDFYFDSSDPENGEYFIEEDYNNGRAIIKFSSRPSATRLTSDYIKVQRKPIQRAPARWENLDVNISLDTSKSWVYIDFPSIDHWPAAATPSTTTVYYESGYYYYEPTYRYRIILSKDIST